MIRLLLAFTAFLVVNTITAQTNVTVNGHLTDISTLTPVPNHYVSVFVHPYSLSVAPYYADSVLTNSAGYFSFDFMLNTPIDSLFVLKVGTFDCNRNWEHKTFDNTNGQTNFSADLYICDSIYQNSDCYGAIEWPNCQNLTVTLHGTGWPDPDFYNWDLGDGTYATGQNVTHTYSTHQRYTIGLTTTNFPDSCTYSGFSTVDLSTTSDCESSFTSNQGNNSFAMNFQATTTSPYSTEFSWSFGDGTSGTGQSISHNYTAAGIYQVTLNSVDSAGCESVYTENVWVADTIINPPSNCENYISQGNRIGLTITLTGFLWSGQPATYYWDMGDGSTYNGQSVTHMYAQSGVYMVKVQSITSDNCVDVTIEPYFVSDSCKNTIYAYGVANLTMAFSGYVENGFTASYFWDLGDGTQSTEQNFHHKFPYPGTYNIVLQTITTDSCVDYSTYTCTLIDSIPNGCNSYFTATAGNNLYEIHFEGSTTSQYPTSFQWNFGDPASGINNTSTLQNPVHVFSAENTFSVTLTTIDSAGCSSTFSAPVILSMFTQYNLYGQVFAGSQTITECKVQLFSQDYTGNMNLIREVVPDSANYYTFDTVSSGIYHILAIPDLGTIFSRLYLPTYFGNAFLWENSTPVILGQAVNPYSIHLVYFDSVSGGDGLINGGLTNGGKSMDVGNQEILILDINNNPVKYMFSQPDGSFSFEGLPYGEYKVYPVITGVKTFPVTVILSDANKTATVNMKISGQSVAGTGDKNQFSNIEKLYPNPATDQIFFSLKSQGKVKIQVIGMSGRKVIEKLDCTAGTGDLFSLSVSELEPGLYILLVQDDNATISSRRFVKN